MPFGSSQWMYSSGFYPTEIDQSLRFDGTSYLSRTPSVAGNRKTWTMSMWFKRGNIGSTNFLFDTRAAVNATQLTACYINSSNFLVFGNGANDFRLTTQVFRDVSAWYHLVVVFDSTQATALDRIKIYINGEQITSFSATNNPSLNTDYGWNQTSAHHIGSTAIPGAFWDGYLADTYFVDGTALDPTSFGEFKSGVWIPKAYTGSYGTNGFHLTYQDDTVSEGLNTVTYTGNGATQSISGIGFSPDLVWIKGRSSAYEHELFDTVRGVNKYISSNSTAVESNNAATLTDFSSDGFSVGAGAYNNANGQTYVAWNWDAGSSTVSNTDGSITSSVRANPAYGFSIVSYTGNNSNATIGHGLSTTPAMIINKQRDSTQQWYVWHKDLSANTSLRLNENAAAFGAGSAGLLGNVGSSTFGFVQGSINYSGPNASGGTYINYCFSEIAGYSKFGSYTGNGSATGPTVTLGFKPAFVMIKRTDVANSWVMYDNTRQTTNPKDLRVLADSSDAEFDGNEYITFTDTGFEIQYSGNLTNASGGTYIYMAFADTRDLAFWRDQSGNGNDWQPTNLNYQDTVFDSPTNNYATLNPLYFRALRPTLSDGNLKLSTSSANDAYFAATIGTGASGKYYFEMAYVSAVNGLLVGAIDNPTTGNANGGTYRNNGELSNFDGSTAATGATYTAGDIVGVAINVDAGELKFYKNNSLQGTVSFTAGTEVFPRGRTNGTGSETATFNFGQSGFTYTPPDGFLALCTANLPEPSISPLYGASPQDYFNTVLYTGTGAAQSITGVGFTPDFTWMKNRSAASGHYLGDTVRGAGYQLISNNTDAEHYQRQNGYITSYDADGFSMTAGSSGAVETNASGNTYAAWNWKASNATAVSNTAGTITSQVSANTTAGFSIVSYTGNGTAGATVGHGLSSAPEFSVTKSRGGVSYWTVRVLNTYDMLLDLNVANSSGNANHTANASTLSLLGSYNNVSAENNIAYCFHSVAGYSKIGSYTGNGSADGPFAYTGFRPAFVMIKRTDSTGNWQMYDTSRASTNVMTATLAADLSSAESSFTGGYDIDFVSNGFKPRTGPSNAINASGGTYIYMAFAENPFKYANAR